MASNCETDSGQSPQCNCGCSHCCKPIEHIIEWVHTRSLDAGVLSGRALVGGHEKNCTPLWVIRARFEGDLVPGKLSRQTNEAYIPYGHKEHRVEDIEVCCASSEKIEWIESRDGNVPHRAVKGGKTRAGEPLYVGRAHYDGALVPGKVHPSSHSFYISYAGNELTLKEYEVLCTVY